MSPSPVRKVRLASGKSTRVKTLLGTAPTALAFFLTGVGTAILGATLPAMLHRWNLSDGSGGLLLLAGWSGSTSGAFFARRSFDRSAALGLSLSAVALLLLSRQHATALLALFLLYGVGLGLTMTSISLLRSRGVTPERADVELNRLNLIWAAGACTAPALAIHSLHLLSVATLYRLIGCVLAVTAMAVLAASLGSDAPMALPREPSLTLPRAPWHLGLFAAASVGMESAVGSWLTTYAERATFGVATAVSANSAFWVGLLLSRAAHSLDAAPWFHTRLFRNLHLLAVGVATALLLLLPGRVVIPCAGLLCGLGLGPLYPYVLSITLPRYQSTSVFVLAGIGASVVPWLTGVLSSATHSLRLGLLAPTCTFVALIFGAFAIRTDEIALARGGSEPECTRL